MTCISLSNIRYALFRSLYKNFIQSVMVSKICTMIKLKHNIFERSQGYSEELVLMDWSDELMMYPLNTKKIQGGFWWIVLDFGQRQGLTRVARLLSVPVTGECALQHNVNSIHWKDTLYLFDSLSNSLKCSKYGLIVFLDHEGLLKIILYGYYKCNNRTR